MKYSKVKKAIFLNRPNRFLANVLIDGKKELVHVRNTGRCKELLVPNAHVILEDCKDSPNRKTRYSLVSVYKDDTLINMDSQIPNDVIFNAIKNNQIHEFKNVTDLKREVTYENSRFDLFFNHNGFKTFLEVKGVTLEDNNIAMFPDAPTTRGSKHVHELTHALDYGYKCAIIFLIQMNKPNLFKLNWERDESFSKAVLSAHSKGVKVLAYDSLVTENSISIGSPIQIDFKKF